LQLLVCAFDCFLLLFALCAFDTFRYELGRARLLALGGSQCVHIEATRLGRCALERVYEAVCEHEIEICVGYWPEAPITAKRRWGY